MNKVEHIDAKVREIKRWMFVGPFAAESIDEDFISVNSVNPNEVFVQNGNNIRWRSWHADGNCSENYIFKEILKTTKFNIYYLANYLYLTKKTTINFYFTTNSICEWFVNGDKQQYFYADQKDSVSFPVDLKRGWNLILVKFILKSDNGNNNIFNAYISEIYDQMIESLLIKNGFLLPNDTESHIFGKNPEDRNQSIEIGDPDMDYIRSSPDFVVYVPKESGECNDGDNEHFLVTKSPKSNKLLAFWTQSSAESNGDNHIMMSVSGNEGHDWSEPEFLVGTTLGGNETQASWGFPVCSLSGRLYLFYTKSQAGVRGGISGIMGTMQSDDEGESWRHGPDIVIPTAYSIPGDVRSKISGNFIVWQLPIRDARGKQIIGYTLWKEKRGRCFFMTFENIDQGPDIEELVITWLPDNNLPVEMPVYLKERECSEPSLVLLPDERLFMTMRTLTGNIWYSTSADNGHTWEKPDELRYEDSGEKIKHPLSCCPIYAMQNGKYLLLHHNNNHFYERCLNDEKLPAGMNQFSNRRPLFVSVGQYISGAHQPIWFDKPRRILDNDGVVIGPKADNEIGTYPSLTEENGKRILWYPDRKYYLLGKRLTDKLLGL